MRLTVGVNVNTGIHVWHEEVLTLGGRGGGSSSVSVRTFIVPLSSSLKKMNNPRYSHLVFNTTETLKTTKKLLLNS